MIRRFFIASTLHIRISLYVRQNRTKNYFTVNGCSRLRSGIKWSEVLMRDARVESERERRRESSRYAGSRGVPFAALIELCRSVQEANPAMWISLRSLCTETTIAVEFAGWFCVICRSVFSIVGCLTLEDVHNDHTFCRIYDRCSSLHSLCCGMRIRHGGA